MGLVLHFGHENLFLTATDSFLKVCFFKLAYKKCKNSLKITHFISQPSKISSAHFEHNIIMLI